jgi:iron complex transport system permease protein
VAVSGIIAFVGLIVPHIIRMLMGPDHRVLFPAAAMGGALFLVWADALSRTVLAPGEIPLGIVTAFAGAPFFIYLLRQRRVLTYAP